MQLQRGHGGGLIGQVNLAEMKAISTRFLQRINCARKTPGEIVHAMHLVAIIEQL